MLRNLQDSAFLKKVMPIKKINRTPKQLTPHKRLSVQKNTRRTSIYQPSSEKQNINSNFCSRQKQPSKQQKPFCQNHPGRPAKFKCFGFIGQMLLCKGCTLKVVSKGGYQVEQLEQFKQNVLTRPNQINDLIQKLKGSMKQIEKKSHNISRLKEQINKHYKQEQENAKTYYSCLISLITTAHQRTKELIWEVKQNQIYKIDKEANRLNEMSKFIQVIQNDLGGQNDQVIYTIVEQQYRPIMNQYNEKKRQIEKQLNNQIRVELESLGNIEQLVEQFTQNLEQKFYLKLQKNSSFQCQQQSDQYKKKQNSLFFSFQKNNNQ